MRGAPKDFVDVVAAARDLVVARADQHALRITPRVSALAWHCDLDDGFTNSDEADPPPTVRWVCRALGLGRSTAPQLEVRRLDARSDLGRLVEWLGRLAGGSTARSTAGGADGRFGYTDPGGIIDAPLRHRIEHWPSARWEGGVVRPAELSSIHVTDEGLIVSSSSWWDSSAALDHQIALAVDIAQRMQAR